MTSDLRAFMLRVLDRGGDMPERTAKLSRYALALLTGLVACIVLVLAWPRLGASMRYLPVDTAMSGYWQSQEIQPPQVDALIERARQVIGLHDHYRYWAGLSELQVLSGQDPAKPYWQRRQLLEQAVSSAEEVVKRAPAKPRAWLRIARVKAFLGRPGEEVIPAWRMSVLTGRVEPTLMLARLELGLTYFGGLDEESVSLLRHQAVLTWLVHKREMLMRLEEGSLDLELLKTVFDGRHPDIVAEMEAG